MLLYQVRIHLIEEERLHDIKQQGRASDAVNYVNLLPSNGDNNINIMYDDGSSTDGIFNTPICGGYDEKAESVYTDIDTNYELGTRMESVPKSDYKFDNPIYQWGRG